MPISIIGMLFISNLDILLKIILSLVCIILMFIIIKRLPVQKDKIIVRSNSIQILIAGKPSKPIKFIDIKSISGSTSLKIELENGNEKIINYSNWLLPIKEAKRLKMILLDRITNVNSEFK